ncbi:hypothetical protein [Pseudomonas sp. TMB3-21]
MTDVTEATTTTTVSGAETAPSQTVAAPAVAPAVTAPAEPAATAPAATEPPAEATKPAGAPEKYEFKAPEGYVPDAQLLAGFESLAKELNLPQDAAQKLMEFDAKRLASSQDAAAADQKAQVEAWIGELKQDKDFGGANFDASVKVAQKAMADFGTPELRQMLDASGLGSHPEVVRFFHRVGKGLGEGSIHKTTTEQPAERSLAERMYPNYPA